jgi:hypothetical protein
MGAFVRILFLTGILLLSSTALLAQERWVYRYADSTIYEDMVYSIVMGAEGNICDAGHSVGVLHDFTVLSLTPSGSERWEYIHNDPGNFEDEASPIICGADGQLYVPGYTSGSGTFRDFTVISLSPELGAQEQPDRQSIHDFRLRQTSPNPFRTSTGISYTLSLTAHVTLEIHDISGRLVETLVNEVQQPGFHQVRWNRRDNPSGVYFYRLSAGDAVKTRKMVLLD